MSSFDYEIKKHEDIIKELNSKDLDNLSKEEKIITLEKIKTEQEFIITLCMLKLNNDNNKEILPKKMVNENIKDSNKNNNKHKSNRKRNKTFDKKINNKEILFEFEIEENIKDLKSFIYEFKDLKILTKFYRKIERKNVIYYECSKRRLGCNGKCQYDKTKEKFIMINNCNNKIEHDAIDFNIFNEDYKNNNLKRYNMEFKKYQEYYVRSLFINNDVIQNLDIYKKFKELFKTQLTLTNNEIIKIKHNTIGYLNNLNIIDLCKELEKDSDLNIKINITDINYKLNQSGKDIEKHESVIIITTKKMRDNVNNKFINNYFIDVTYKILPKNRKSYKLLTISGFDEKKNLTIILFLILIIHEDYKSFYLIFKYLNLNFNFNPNNIHIDFSQAERKALLQENLFNSKPIIISCLFHFTQSVFRKMKNLKLVKTKLNKKNFEILRNIELICFINPVLLQEYSKFLKKI